ncbi:class I SAM-dependent methyltransferase [Pseudonocardia kunmingensis]|nr:class I SAM-dependent methyltransferase [Pseudonocardia kunmingensis]
MPTLPPEQHRDMAESFGTDPERYDRARPRYPDALVEAVVAAAPGPDVLDVGCGTGIASRQFRAAGCRVLGVDVDARMAAFARRSDLEVEVAAFERWDPAGRAFDAVVAGQTWHWVDPVAGAAAAARVLRPHGLLAVFWNEPRPAPEVADAFAAVYRRVVPDSLTAQGLGAGSHGHSPLVSRALEGIREAGGFGEPEQWRFDWQRSYSRDEWLDQLVTGGEAARFAPATLDELVAGIGAAVDALGGSVAMPYATVAVVARTRTNGTFVGP